MTKKHFLSVFCTLLSVLMLLCACGGNDVAYRTDVSAQAVADNCASALPSFAYLSSVDDDYIKYRMMLDTTNLESYVVYIPSAGAILDEIGIFKCPTDDTAAVASMAEKYLANRNDEWTGMYLVEEYPKLRDAEVRVFGCYVVYGILSEADKDAFFTAVDTYLKSAN